MVWPDMITAGQYEAFHRFLEENCGIVLGPEREYLVSSRLGGFMQRCGYDSLTELLDRLYQGDRQLKSSVIDLMTTNETSWFRHEAAFEYFADHVLEELRRQPQIVPAIWSAACSYGQEPYSLSMVVDEFRQRHPGSHQGLRITATDISSSALAFASQACYSEAALERGLTARRRQAFFERHGRDWRVVAAVRRRVHFREYNLLADFAALGRFDVIFCRNVLIYFAPAVKQDILERMAATLRPGGYLFLGGAESVGPAGRHFTAERFGQNIVYRRR